MFCQVPSPLVTFHCHQYFHSLQLSNLLTTLQVLPFRSSHCGAAEMNLTSIHEDDLAQWVGDLALLLAVV